MSGRIPRYGKNFTLVSLPYTPGLGSRAYVLKADPDWFLRADRTSKRWQVYRKAPGNIASWDMASVTAMGRVQPSLREAMSLLLDGIDQGFYAITGQED